MNTNSVNTILHSRLFLLEKCLVITSVESPEGLLIKTDLTGEAVVFVSGELKMKRTVSL